MGQGPLNRWRLWYSRDPAIKTVSSCPIVWPEGWGLVWIKQNLSFRHKIYPPLSSLKTLHRTVKLELLSNSLRNLISFHFFVDTKSIKQIIWNHLSWSLEILHLMLEDFHTRRSNDAFHQGCTGREKHRDFLEMRIFCCSQSCWVSWVQPAG